MLEQMVLTVLRQCALALEVVATIFVVAGAIAAVAGAVTGIRRDPTGSWKRDAWFHFAGWIGLSLEFALGADIIRTIVVPTWDELGKLAVLAAVRTALNYFLARDLDELRPKLRAGRSSQ